MTFTGKVQLKSSDGFRGDNFAFRTLEIKGVERALDDTRTALDAQVRPGHRCNMSPSVHLITIPWTDLLTETDTPALLLIENDPHQPVLV